MVYRTVLAAVSVACLMSTAIATTAAAQEVAAPYSVASETGKALPDYSGSLRHRDGLVPAPARE